MLRALGFACTLIVLAPAAAAQTDVFPNLWVTSSRVEGMAVLGDTLFVTGRFRSVGPPTGQLAVLDKTTGEPDLSQPRFSALGLSSIGVTVALPDGTGGYYASGTFSAVAGRPRFNLARVRPDGTLDPTFRPDPTAGGSFGVVSALALDGSTLYVSGRFDTAGGQPRQDLAAFDVNTGALLPLRTDFVRTGSFFGIHSVVVAGGIIYVAGEFSAVSGQPRSGLAALDATTGALLSWGPSLTADSTVPDPYAATLALGETTLYASGRFRTVNGQPRPDLVELTLADPVTGGGGEPTSWVPETGLSFNFVVVGDDLWGGAEFGFLGRISRITGARGSVLPSGIGRVESLAYDPVGGPSGAGVLYVGAERATGSGGDPVPTVTGIDPATGQQSGFEVHGASQGATVGALAVEPGPAGRLFAGGTFVSLGTGVADRPGFAAFDLTTGRATDFATDLTGLGDGLFEDLALAPDGRYLYGYSRTIGSFTLTEFDLATGARREFIPRAHDADGQPRRLSDAEFEALPSTKARTTSASVPPNPRVENAASAIAVTDDGAGGGRVCISASGVACYDRASAQRLFYTPLPSVGGQGDNNGDLLFLPPGGPVAGPGGAEGTLYLAAPVEEAPAGTVRPAFIALDAATGAVLPSWDVGFGGQRGPEGYTLALLDPDGAGGPLAPTLYLGGDREWTVQGQPRQELAAVAPTSAALQPWAPRVSGGPVFSMAAHRAEGGAVVYAGGAFRFVDGQLVATSMAAFDAETGAYLPEWNPVTYSTLVSLMSERHGAVFLGGTYGDALQGDGGLGGGTGHAGVVGVSPARPLLPTAGDAGVPEVPRSAGVALAGPNPLRSRTALAVSLPEAQTVEASLYDVLGRRVSVLHAGPLPAGISRLDVDASALPAGVYVARVTGAGFTEALTLTVVR